MVVAVIRFISIDDHPIISDAIALAAAGEDDLELVGTFPSIELVPGLLRTPESFDVAVLDLNLGGSGGVEGVATVAGWGPRVLVYSASSTARLAEQSISAGATGFVAKSVPTRGVLDAIRSVARGERVTLGVEPPETPLSELTEADRQLLVALTEQTRSKELARTLGMSTGTVDNMIARLYWKLGLDAGERSRASLRDWARRNGYGTPTNT